MGIIKDIHKDELITIETALERQGFSSNQYNDPSGLREMRTSDDIKSSCASSFDGEKGKLYTGCDSTLLFSIGHYSRPNAKGYCFKLRTAIALVIRNGALELVMLG